MKFENAVTHRLPYLQHQAKRVYSNKCNPGTLHFSGAQSQKILGWLVGWSQKVMILPAWGFLAGSQSRIRRYKCTGQISLMNFFVGERCGQGTTCLVPCAHFPRQPTSYKRKICEVLLVLATIAVELLDTCSARLIGAEYSRLFPGVNLHKPRLQNTVDIHLHSLSLPLSQDAVGMQGPPYRGVKVTRKAFLNYPRFLANILSLVPQIDLILHIMIELNVFQHLATLQVMKDHSKFNILSQLCIFYLAQVL